MDIHSSGPPRHNFWPLALRLGKWCALAFLLVSARSLCSHPNARGYTALSPGWHPKPTPAPIPSQEDVANMVRASVLHHDKSGVTVRKVGSTSPVVIRRLKDGSLQFIHP